MTKKITIDDDMVRRAIKKDCFGGSDMFSGPVMMRYRDLLDAALNPPHEHTWSVLRAVLTMTGCREVEEVCWCGDRRTRIEPPLTSVSAARCHHRKGDLVVGLHCHQRSADRGPHGIAYTHKRSTDQ